LFLLLLLFPYLLSTRGVIQTKKIKNKKLDKKQFPGRKKTTKKPGSRCEREAQKLVNSKTQTPHKARKTIARRKKRKRRQAKAMIACGGGARARARERERERKKEKTRTHKREKRDTKTECKRAVRNSTQVENRTDQI